MKEKNLIRRIRMNAPSSIIRSLDAMLDFIGRYLLSPIVLITVSSTLILITSFLILLYFINGYQLSGNEIVVGFILGYLLGLILLFISKLFN